MTSYVSTTEITQERFIDMYKKPVGKSAVKKLKNWKTTKIIGIAASVLIAAVAFSLDYPEFSVIAGVMGAVMVYQLFFEQERKLKKLYADTLKKLTGKKWVRTITFDSRITLTDDNSTSVFNYSDFRWVQENETHYLLFKNEDVALRIEKGSFTYGKEENFLGWIKNKISTK